MKTSSHKSVFNLKEAAAYLGISVPTLVRLLGSGAIPYRRVGQRWLIARSALTSGWYSGSRMERKSKRDYETKQKQTQVAGMIMPTWVIFCHDELSN